jgi:protein-tyrosine phosphatase
MRFLLSPYVTAARINSRLWTRRDAAQEIVGGVWIGRVPRSSECDALGMASVVDLTAELPFDGAGATYRGVPMLDLMVPTVEQLDAAVSAIDELTPNRPTLVCCALGYSRSATAAVAWLVASRTSESVEAAIVRLLSIRPRVRLSQAHRMRLAEWMARRNGAALNLSDDVADDVAVNVCQPEVAAAVPIGKPRMVEAEKMQ